MNRALARVGPAESKCVIARARHTAGIAALANGDHLKAFTQLRALFRDNGNPLHYHISYLGIADFRGSRGPR